MSENKYPIGGYAPGNYHNRCSTCERSFFGDKRAVQCEPCALASLEKFNALSPAEQNELLKKNAEIMNEFIKKNSSTEQLSGTDHFCGKTELNNLATISVTELLYAIIGACDAASEQGLDYPKALAKVKRYAYDALKLDQPKPARAVWVKASEWPKDHNIVHWRRASDKKPLLVIGRNYQDNIVAQFGKVYTPDELEWLDESGSAANELPAFRDAAKAFKWAAEYRDEIGGQLTLYNDQWTIISEDEDGNENETQDLTPVYVAELYCLQNGFDKESPTPNNDHITAALRKFVSMHETGLLPNRFTYEEGKKALESIENSANNDAIKFAEFAALKCFFDEGTRLWETFDESADPFRFTTKELYNHWQQSKSK